MTSRYSVVLAAVAMAATVACSDSRKDEAVGVDGTAQTAQTAQTAGRSDITDTRITAEVQGKFFTSETVKGNDIDVDTREGTVTLRGTVPSEQARQDALQFARAVDGVRNVRDELTIAGAATATVASEGTAGTAGTAGTTSDERNPGWITTKIQAQYYLNPGLKPWNIDVTTSRDGVVTLAGAIDNETDRAEAVRIAKATEGVSDVRDQLRADRQVVATTGSDAKTERDAKTNTTAGGAVAAVEDGWITAKIQSKYFLDSGVKGRNIDVDTKSGVVTVKGDVQSYGERRQAVSMARSTEGVREVRDELRVNQTLARGTGQAGQAQAGQSGQPVEDTWITTKLQSKFFIDDQVRASKVDVTTTNGVVTLSGVVTTDEARKAAEELARDTEGVKSVTNRLTVSAAGKASQPGPDQPTAK